MQGKGASKCPLMKSEIGLGFFLALVKKDQGNGLCTELRDLPKGMGWWWLTFNLFLELPQVCTRHRLAFIPTNLWMFCCEMATLLLVAFVEKARISWQVSGRLYGCLPGQTPHSILFQSAVSDSLPGCCMDPWGGLAGGFGLVDPQARCVSHLCLLKLLCNICRGDLGGHCGVSILGKVRISPPRVPRFREKGLGKERIPKDQLYYVCVHTCMPKYVLCSCST